MGYKILEKMGGEMNRGNAHMYTKFKKEILGFSKMKMINRILMELYDDYSENNTIERLIEFTKKFCLIEKKWMKWALSPKISRASMTCCHQVSFK